MRRERESRGFGSAASSSSAAPVGRSDEERFSEGMRKEREARRDSAEWQRDRALRSFTPEGSSVRSPLPPSPPPCSPHRRCPAFGAVFPDLHASHATTATTELAERVLSPQRKDLCRRPSDTLRAKRSIRISLSTARCALILVDATAAYGARVKPFERHQLVLIAWSGSGAAARPEIFRARPYQAPRQCKWWCQQRS